MFTMSKKKEKHLVSNLIAVLGVIAFCLIAASFIFNSATGRWDAALVNLLTLMWLSWLSKDHKYVITSFNPTTINIDREAMDALFGGEVLSTKTKAAKKTKKQ